MVVIESTQTLEGFTCHKIYIEFLTARNHKQPVIESPSETKLNVKGIKQPLFIPNHSENLHIGETH
jgi:hypothetical protein